MIMKMNFSKIKWHSPKQPVVAGLPVINFYRDWKIIVLVFGVGLVSMSLFAWKVYLSDQIAGGYLPMEIPATDMVIKTVDLRKLEETLQFLDNKQIDFTQSEVVAPKYKDPSF